MNRHVGIVDRAIRAIAGQAIVGLGVASKSWSGAIGVVPLLAAAIGWCPAYLPFGISTSPSRRAEART